MGLFLLFLGLILCAFGKAAGPWLIITGSALLLAAAFFPYVLRPVYVIWMGGAALLGSFMTRLLLSIIFFLIFAPIGLLFRLIRKDHLNMAIQPETETYWKMREAKPYVPEMSEKQS